MANRLRKREQRPTTLNVMERLRILHITDLHLRDALPGTADRKERLSREVSGALERLAGRLGDWTPDVLAVSGDLLDVPDEVIDGRLARSDPAARTLAADQAARDYRLMRDRFDAFDLPYIVIPGNHDLRAAFEPVFKRKTRPLELGRFKFLGFDDDLDTARKPFRPPAELARFRAALEDGSPGRTQIHIQHYLVAPRIFRRHHYSYPADLALRRRLEGSGRVGGVLSGHYHPGAWTRSPAGVVYSTAPAFGEAPFPVRLLDFMPDGTVEMADMGVD